MSVVSVGAGKLRGSLLGLICVSLLLGGLLGLTLVLLGGIGRSGGLRLAAVGRGPESEVVTEQLHDEGAVTVRLLGQRVELGNGVVEGLLREMASPVGRVQDLVVEDGEVQGQTEADGVSGSELSLGNIGSALCGGRAVSIP